VTGKFHDSQELLGAGVEKSAGTTPLLIRDYMYDIQLQFYKSVEACNCFPNAFCAILLPNRLRRSLTTSAASQCQIACTKKSRADRTRGMSATIRSTILSSPLTAKKMPVEIHRIMILPVALYRCETRLLTFRIER